MGDYNWKENIKRYRLFDKGVKEAANVLQQLLADNGLIVNCYDERVILTKNRDKNKVRCYPIMEQGEMAGDYTKLMPHEENYCFFLLGDPMTQKGESHFAQLERPFSLYVYYNINTIADNTMTERQPLPSQVVDVFVSVINHIPLHYSHITLNQIYSDYENVWRGMTIDDTEVKFWYYPYYTLRITGTMKVNQTCNN